jgi:hypothetical protein
MGMSASGAYYCYWPMPFARSARIVLENRQVEAVGEVYWEIERAPGGSGRPANGARFHADWRREAPTNAGRDFVLLDLPAGQGTYLGHVLSVEPFGPENKQWWEGDLRIWADHRLHPLLQGTGHEDEMLGGWSSRWLRGPYSLPLHGLPVVRLFPDRVDSQWNGAMSGYRFFAGGIPFRDGIRVSSEHGTNNVVVTNYSSVAYYYYRPEPAMTLTDSFEPGDAQAAAAHAYESTGGGPVELERGFEAADADPQPVRVYAHRGRIGQQAERFFLRVSPANSGVLLRRLYDQGAGAHAASLQVNGRDAGGLAEPEALRVERWREQDILLPAAITNGHDRVEIRIEARQGTWNAFRYAAYSLAGSP